MADAVLETEIWLRESGLPSFTRRRVAPSSRRVGAVLALFSGLELAVLVPARQWPWWVNLLLVAVVPVISAFLVARAFDATTRRSTTAPGRMLGNLAFVVLPTVIAATFATPLAAALTAMSNLLVLGALSVDYRFGVVAVARWCVVHGIGQVKVAVGRLSRSVPLLAVIVLSLFYTGEVWQASAGLSTANLVATVALLATTGVGFAVSRIRSGIGEQVVAPAAYDIPSHHPAAQLPCCNTAPKLTRIEQGNIAVLLVVSQLCVVAATALAFAAMIVLLGSIAIPVDVLTDWIGGPPNRLVSVSLGVDVHLTAELLALGAIMAGIAGLVFAVSLAGDEDFQDASRQHLADEIALALAARGRYLASLTSHADVSTPAAHDS